jgi:hypothetical protein
MQYLIQITAHMTINNELCFVMLFVHFSALIDHLKGNNLQRNKCVTSAVKMSIC